MRGSADMRGSTETLRSGGSKCSLDRAVPPIPPDIRPSSERLRKQDSTLSVMSNNSIAMDPAKRRHMLRKRTFGSIGPHDNTASIHLDSVPVSAQERRDSRSLAASDECRSLPPRGSRELSRGQVQTTAGVARYANHGYQPIEVTAGDSTEQSRMSTDIDTWSRPGVARDATAVKTEEHKSWCSIQRCALAEMFCSCEIPLLLFVPLGLMAKHQQYRSALVFLFNFVAIIPLASLLGKSTEALAVYTGQLIGGLLNATFGNAVEMIMVVQAVKLGLVRVVQDNLLGSILSNLLLVLGMAICASGIVRRESTFNSHGAAANMTCQLVASISVCLPTVFETVMGSDMVEVLAVSRICSVFLISVYGLFLFFMLKTHAELFQDEPEEELEEEATLSPTMSVGLLLISTLLVAGCSEALVHSIEDVSDHYGVPKAFIGTIMLPIVGNAAEHATAVTAAYKGMMDLALGVAVGSSTQIALFVVPCATMFGWLFDQPMNLAFQDFQMMCLMLSVFLVSQVLQNGNTNWLHGAMLITVYLFIATMCCYVPDKET